MYCNCSLCRSPTTYFTNYANDSDFYNMTMSYRLDSEFSWFYGTTTDLASDENIAPALNIQWKEPDDSFQANNEVIES